jgi:DNA-binding MarR family transcriptional regulator
VSSFDAGFVSQADGGGLLHGIRNKGRQASARRNGALTTAISPSVSSRRNLTVSRPALLDGGSDQSFRQFVHDMLAFAARIQEVRSRLGRVINLAGQKYTVLIAIAHLQDQDGGVGINEIADHLHLSSAFVTIETNGLLKSGLVVKRTNPTDRRRVLLMTTPKAAKLLDKLTVVQAPVNDALFACLSVKNFVSLRQMISRLVETGDGALRLLDEWDLKKKQGHARRRRP